MKLKNKTLALLLSVGLICAIALGLLLSPENLSVHLPEIHGLRITEICTKNETVIADNSGSFPDYIELFNGGEAVDLTGFTLTDGRKTSPPLDGISLASQEYRVIFLSDALTGFALGASGGDCIQLLDPGGRIVAQVTATAMAADEVMLWQDGRYAVSHQATPGFSNDAQGLLAFTQGIPEDAPKLLINELLTGNESAFPDENGRFSDAVELYNATEEPLDLSRYSLSDNAGSRFVYRLPHRILAPGEYAVVICDGENRIAQDGTVHTNFGLSAGETLYLTDSSGRFLSLNATRQGEDLSLSLLADGTFAPAAPSLGYPNTESGIAAFAQSRINENAALVISEVLLSTSGVPYGGKLTDAVELCNTSQETLSTAGWYLSDGGDPFRYPLPETMLKPGELLVIPCASGTTGFSLAEGETLRLIGPDFFFSPPVVCACGLPGQSTVLLDGSFTFGPVTLGYPNREENSEKFLSDSLAGSLRISEVMSVNTSILPGPYGAVSDWVELYNAGSAAIDLKEYALSDSSLESFPLPDKTLGPGEYLVIFLSQEDIRLRYGYDMLPFALSAAGDALYLTKAGSIEDYVLIPELGADISYGRGAGSLSFGQLETPSPGKANGAAVHISAPPLAVTPQGAYDNVTYVEVTLQGQGDIYYTTDCTVPTAASFKYTAPIRLTKTTVLRVMCQTPGYAPSKTVDLTYLINENDTLPTVSVVTHPDLLWSKDKGIYVWGNKKGLENANFWQGWEYPASVSMFETDGLEAFSSPCGIRVHGTYSRIQEKKSLACVFRSQYGAASLEYPLFGEEGLDSYKAFVLRSAGQDAFYARMRDVLITSLAAETGNIPVQKYRAVAVYLNGEYFGLHYIREKLDEDFVAGNYNADAADVLLTQDHGDDCAEYQDLVRYAMNHDLREESHYAYICSQIDIDNYIDFTLAQIWIGNNDKIGNIKFFKTPEGKWTWPLYDTDLGFHDIRGDTVSEHLTGNLGLSDPTGKTFAVRLLQNQEFKDKFLSRMAWQMNNIWTKEHILARIAELEALVEGDIAKELSRWDSSYEEWQTHVSYLRGFAKTRNRYLLPHIQSFFGLSDSQMRSYGFP